MKKYIYCLLITTITSCAPTKLSKTYYFGTEKMNKQEFAILFVKEPTCFITEIDGLPTPMKKIYWDATLTDYKSDELFNQKFICLKPGKHHIRYVYIFWKELRTLSAKSENIYKDFHYWGEKDFTFVKGKKYSLTVIDKTYLCNNNYFGDYTEWMSAYKKYIKVHIR